ncbi:MAG: hypothetical protein KGH93_00380 [Patescibacteria group bacterium]|nr:hypothetical protein [Patescibacteria group bacterium]MDE1945646.1 hypothetical protein [Patescibacteria group bacterium]
MSLPIGQRVKIVGELAPKKEIKGYGEMHTNLRGTHERGEVFSIDRKRGLILVKPADNDGKIEEQKPLVPYRAGELLPV